MTVRKTTKSYHFTVEGETENWYLERLQNLINQEPLSRHNVALKKKIEKNPLNLKSRLDMNWGTTTLLLSCGLFCINQTATERTSIEDSTCNA